MVPVVKLLGMVEGWQRRGSCHSKGLVGAWYKFYHAHQLNNMFQTERLAAVHLPNFTRFSISYKRNAKWCSLIKCFTHNSGITAEFTALWKVPCKSDQHVPADQD